MLYETDDTADKIDRLRSNLIRALDNNHALCVRMNAAQTDLERAKKAIQEIVKRNAEFLEGMPDEWPGDPLQDAIEAASALFAH